MKNGEPMQGHEGQRAFHHAEMYRNDLLRCDVPALTPHRLATTWMKFGSFLKTPPPSGKAPGQPAGTGLDSCGLPEEVAKG